MAVSQFTLVSTESEKQIKVNLLISFVFLSRTAYVAQGHLDNFLPFLDHAKFCKSAFTYLCKTL